MAVEAGPRDPCPAVPRRVWATGALAALVVAVASSLLTPLMALPDEPAHAVHAVAVAHGTLVGEDAVETDAATGWTRTETAVEVPAAYAALPAVPTCFAFAPTQPADCAPPVESSAGPDVTARTTVGTYAPAWYAAVGWPSQVLPPPAALYAMRWLAAAGFAVLLGVAVASLWRTGARGWGMVGLVMAVPPVAVHLAGGLNPSGTEIAAGVALWAASLELLRCPPSRAAVARWTVAGVVVAAVRPLGPAIAVGVPVVAWMLLGSAPARRRLADDGAVRGGAVVVVATSLLALGWSLWRGTLSAFSGFPDADATVGSVVRRSLGLLPERLAEMVGVLGWSDVSLPRVLVAGWLLAVGVLVVAALRGSDRRFQLVLVLLAVGVVALPVAADLRSVQDIGFVWQGRYTLPMAVGLPLVAGAVLDERPPSGVATRWSVAVLALLVVGHLVALLAVARRFGSGADAAWTRSLDPMSWSPPVPVPVLVLAAAVALVVPIVALVQHARGVRGRFVATG